MGDIIRSADLTWKPEQKNYWLNNRNRDIQDQEFNLAKASALEETGWESAAMRDYKKALALASPIEYLNNRLQRQSEYRDKLLRSFQSDFDESLKITGSVGMAKQMAKRKMVSMADHYSTLLETEWPGLSDATNKLAKNLSAAAEEFGK